MQILEAYCPNWGMMRFIGARLNAGHDFLLDSNCGDAGEIDVLIWLDSRGVSNHYSGSLAHKLITFFSESKQRYLLICRPLELTTWATLINFMEINTIHPRKLLTNMGMVDFTPKKKDVLADALAQVVYMLGSDDLSIEFAEHYVGSAGDLIELYVMYYGSLYSASVRQLVACQRTIVINTPLVPKDINIKRSRPKSFSMDYIKLKNLMHRLQMPVP